MPKAAPASRPPDLGLLATDVVTADPRTIAPERRAASTASGDPGTQCARFPHSTELDPAWQVGEEDRRLPISSSRPRSLARFHLLGEVELERERGGPGCGRAPANLGAGAARSTRGGGGRRASALRAGRSGPRPGGGGERRPHASPAAPLAALPPAPADPHLAPQLSHLFRSAPRHRRPCGCRRPLPGPPWCSDDAPGEPLRPLPRLGSRRPPASRPAAQTGERRLGRAEEGGSERSRARGGLRPVRPLVGRYGVATAPADAAVFPQPEQRAESGNLGRELLVPAARLLEVCRGFGDAWWR
ncbi:unnamed protein product [Rangifer tarandus platyrhynchus]|uniref:Uncharacterized protein n=2 Tax=Rangifer tarandus platyrhynchus TaxID=3082113 RepID=A0ACB0F5C8_RANTA|nr:unnamed protein product [Rangifer tarandus platyrhynchus]CAI9708094.1 unnamed protein product [Rangifer tarandus platyrhynchus]